MNLRSLVLAAATVSGGCAAERSTYSPVATTSARLDGQPAASVALPSDAPPGELQLSALGVIAVRYAESGRAEERHVLCVRMLAANESDVSWTLDPTDQKLALQSPSGEESRLAMTVMGGRPPVVEIAPQQTVIVELLFPLERRESRALDRFEVRWTIRAGTPPRAFGGVVPFLRTPETTLHPAPPPPGVAAPPYRIPRGYPPPPARP